MKTDPRDKQFYRLKKKGLKNLTKQECLQYLSYAQKAYDYVDHKNARKGWNILIQEIQLRLEKLQ